MAAELRHVRKDISQILDVWLLPSRPVQQAGQAATVIAEHGVPDNAYIGLYANQTFGVGTNHELAFNWILHGQDASLIPYITQTHDVTAGWDLGAGVLVGLGYYVGPGEIRADYLIGPRTFANASFPGSPYAVKSNVGFSESGLPSFINFEANIGPNLGIITGRGSGGIGYVLPVFRAQFLAF